MRYLTLCSNISRIAEQPPLGVMVSVLGAVLGLCVFGEGYRLFKQKHNIFLSNYTSNEKILPPCVFFSPETLRSTEADFNPDQQQKDITILYFGPLT